MSLPLPPYPYPDLDPDPDPDLDPDPNPKSYPNPNPNPNPHSYLYPHPHPHLSWQIQHRHLAKLLRDRESAAVTVQTQYRCFADRYSYYETTIRRRAVVHIQTWARCKSSKNAVLFRVILQRRKMDASDIIQKYARRYLGGRVALQRRRFLRSKAAQRALASRANIVDAFFVNNGAATVLQRAMRR